MKLKDRKIEKGRIHNSLDPLFIAKERAARFEIRGASTAQLNSSGPHTLTTPTI